MTVEANASVDTPSAIKHEHAPESHDHGQVNDPIAGPVMHVYDDIQECDNHLPNWWLYTLFGTVIFGIIYWGYYHMMQTGLGSRESFEIAMQADYAAAAERARRSGTVTAQSLAIMARDRSVVERGRAQFQRTCVACHGANGQGLVGPNLTDNAWIYGGAPDRIYRTIYNGTRNGMAAWGPGLGDETVVALTTYVMSIKNTNVPGRPPQGTVE